MITDGNVLSLADGDVGLGGVSVMQLPHSLVVEAPHGAVELQEVMNFGFPYLSAPYLAAYEAYLSWPGNLPEASAAALDSNLFTNWREGPVADPAWDDNFDMVAELVYRTQGDGSSYDDVASYISSAMDAAMANANGDKEEAVLDMFRD